MNMDKKRESFKSVLYAVKPKFHYAEFPVTSATNP